MNSANKITRARQLSAFAQLEIKKRSLLKLLRWTNASSQSKGNLVIAIVVDSSRWETSFPLWLENPGRIGQEYGKKTDMSSRCWLAHAPSISLAVSIERLVLQHNFSPHLTCLCLYVLLSFWFQSCLPVVASEQSLDLNGISVPNNGQVLAEQTRCFIQQLGAAAIGTNAINWWDCQILASRDQNRNKPLRVLAAGFPKLVIQQSSNQESSKNNRTGPTCHHKASSLRNSGF